MRVTIPELSLVLLIGPAGSGKSDFAARHFRPSEVLSLARIQQMVTDDDWSDGAEEAGWGALLEIAARRLQWGRLTVIDAALTTPARRQPLLQLASDSHYIPSAFIFGSQAANPLDGERFRHIFHFASEREVAAVEIHRIPLWSNRQDETGPFDIIGSVHGCNGELVELLMKLGYRLEPEILHPRGRKLVFLGDLADRGTDGLEVLRMVMNAVDASVAYSVPGNHDARLLRWLQGERLAPSPEIDPAMAAFATASPELRQQIETFIESSVSHYVFDRGNLVVAHAGLKEDMQGRGSSAVRAFALNGESLSEGEPARPVPAWVLEYQGAARVVYSHPTVAEPLWLNNTVNLDTGSFAEGGRITALRYPEMQLVSVPVAAPERAALALE
jgi:protein phosphatase